MQITIYTLTGNAITIPDVEPSEKVGDLKKRIQDRTGIAVERQTLIFEGKILQHDFKTLQDYGIGKGPKAMILLIIDKNYGRIIDASESPQLVGYPQQQQQRRAMISFPEGTQIEIPLDLLMTIAPHLFATTTVQGIVPTTANAATTPSEASVQPQVEGTPDATSAAAASTRTCRPAYQLTLHFIPTIFHTTSPAPATTTTPSTTNPSDDHRP
eukprot:GEZU01043635.1.p1 GENE.GEZU01043635.1~~GEZU01043635.1.p1  ORF type:complete len:213 (-),score=52.56 GEZU01043635.1:74-712(-)